MSSDPKSLDSLGKQWLILLRTHFRIQMTKLKESFTKARLKSLTMLGFLTFYGIASYLLLNRGFQFVMSLPAAGGLIMDRLIHVVFFCFMMMLIFSSAVTAYISIYRGKDVRWLISLPVSHRIVFLWKCFESALFSTWGLFIIIAPLLMAFANQRDVPWTFYPKSILALIPFLVICASLGSIMLILVGRFMNRRQFAIVASIAAVLIIGTVARTAMTDRKIIRETGLNSALTFQRVLGHTNLATNRVMPSTWLAASIVEWSHPYSTGRNWLMPSLLMSNCLMLPLVLSSLGKGWFYLSWNRTLQSNAASANSRGRNRGNLIELKKFGLFTRILGRPMGAVAKKDLITFIREPAQWAQFTIVFGLLAIYASGLNKLHSQLEEPRELYLVAFLNLAVSALALSTLTTRFVFPQFSLEGQKLWILAMSPIRISGIVMQKFITSTLATGLAVSVILYISSHSLKFDRADTLFFGIAVLCLAIGLNAIAVGLGVLFPNLRESNTAKIVSGFGGTLCLVLSFLYIVTFMITLVFVRSEVFYENIMVENWFISHRSLTGFAIAAILTFFTTVIPIYFSRKKLKDNGIIGNF